MNVKFGESVFLRTTILARRCKPGCRISLVVAALMIVIGASIAGGESTCFGTDEIIAPSVTTSNLPSEFGTATANVTNQSGLSIAYTPGVTDFDSYLGMGPTHDGGPEGNVWLIAGTVANFDMDFGSDVTVDAIAIWNKDGIFGVGDFNLLAADSPDFVDATNLLSGTLALQPNNPIPTPFEQFDFATTTSRYYRIEILNNLGAGFTGLGELAFSAAGGILLGDVNLDGMVDLLDVAPFVKLIVTEQFQAEADINGDGFVDLLDVAPFIELLTGQ